MNNIEEKLWEYIDGRCTPDEQKTISSLIADNEAVRLKYNDLLSLNAGFSTMELDEPPMAFTYNVMEAIRAEQAQKPLKSAINKRIIIGIAGFFVFTILALLLYVVTGIHWSTVNIIGQLPATVKMPAVKGAFTTPLLTGFFFFDVVLGLFLFDGYLRRMGFKKKV